MRIPQSVLAVTSLALTWVAAPVMAQQNPVVVELYTSQGCSSCPPADAILAELAEWPGVVALALHVDYWDYLGWKDSFGKPEHSLRQRAYAKAAGKRSLYTPQMIVQGQERVAGADAAAVASLVAEHQNRPPQVTLDVERDADKLSVSLAPASPAGVGPSEIYLVRFDDAESVAIEDGENAGVEVDYANIVTDWSSIGLWDGVTPIDLALPLKGSEPLAVIVQRERLGPVLGAATLP